MLDEKKRGGNSLQQKGMEGWGTAPGLRQLDAKKIFIQQRAQLRCLLNVEKKVSILRDSVG